MIEPNFFFSGFGVRRFANAWQKQDVNRNNGPFFLCSCRVIRLLWNDLHMFFLRFQVLNTQYPVLRLWISIPTSLCIVACIPHIIFRLIFSDLVPLFSLYFYLIIPLLPLSTSVPGVASLILSYLISSPNHTAVLINLWGARHT